MGVYDRTLTIAHRADDLFELVSDIRRYPEFVKWIKSMRVYNEREQGTTRLCTGEARVGFSGLTETFATDVKADPEARRIETRLVRGPFRRLLNTWQFEAMDDGTTRVRFHIDYKFKNPVLQALLAANFDRAVNALINSFLAEADRRYEKTGQVNLPGPEP